MSLSGIDERPGRPLALGLAWAALLACACWAWFAFQGAASERPLAAGVSVLPPPAPLHTAELMLLFAMWTGLCTSLMLPAMAGAVAVYLRVARRRAAVRWPRLATAMFALGCLLAWTGFAALVTLLHWALHDAGALDNALAIPYPGLGLALVAAGAWQWTPAKHACLEHCRAPLPGVLADWQGGALAPLWQGAEHARQCLGCCWLLVLLLLAGGPGNPAIVALVALLALAELRMSEGHLAAGIAGLAMVALGTLLLFP
jgi:predicted metal-binding membrane protein